LYLASWWIVVGEIEVVMERKEEGGRKEADVGLSSWRL